MSATVIIGTQWGDEGKGKVVDALSEKADCVVRYQGGANAGHTLKVGDSKTILHLIPSGILQKDTSCIIGPGVSIDLEALYNEIKELKSKGLLQNDDQLKISNSCTIIFPYHKKLDQLREKKDVKNQIGTTGKGIGPSYEDRASRRAVILGDFFNEKTLKEKIANSLKEINFLLKNMYQDEGFEVDDIYNTYLKIFKEIKHFCRSDISMILEDHMEKNDNVIFEGAQGSLLDLYHGTYPFVTSSSTLSGASCVGAGVSPFHIKKVFGIMKAYATRVGEGFFPTEEQGEAADQLQKQGDEFGATTGRKRRCGWLDLVAARYSCRINGVTELFLMKLDVLSHFDEIKVCTAYEVDGKTTQVYPTELSKLEKIKPVYKVFPGWDKIDIKEVKEFDKLPIKAQNYINFISEYLKTPIHMISVGPERNQSIWL